MWELLADGNGVDDVARLDARGNFKGNRLSRQLIEIPLRHREAFVETLRSGEDACVAPGAPHMVVARA